MDSLNQENMLAQVNVGSPPPSGFPRWESVDVCFHDFVNLDMERGEAIDSPEFACLGHLWTVGIFPGGEDGRNKSSEGMVAIYLYNMSEQPIDVDAVISIRDLDGKEAAACPVVIRRTTFGSLESWGMRNAVERTQLLSNLVYGSLVLGVRMKKSGPMNGPMTYVPTNPLCKNILQKFMDEGSADVVFEVVSSSDDQDGEDAHKQTKNATAFPAHRFIVQDGAPLLAELCKAGKGDHATVQVTDVQPFIFHHMLYFVYGGVIPRGDLNANAKDLIEASDKYGIISLKLGAEAAYVESTKITVENVLDNLSYADSKNLAVLKEAVMDFMFSNEDDIIGKISFDNVPGSTMTDLLAAISRGKKNEDEIDDYNATNYNKLSVGTLRMLLYGKGLDVDGSREAMVALLKQNREEEQA